MSDNNQVWEVEDILDRRLNVENQQYEYYVKWLRYPSTENTWEPLEHLKQCQQMMRKIDEGKSAQNLRVRRVTRNGFARKQTVDAIVGASKMGGELHLLIRWKGISKLELLPITIVRKRVPQMVIKFFEMHTTWAQNYVDMAITL